MKKHIAKYFLLATVASLTLSSCGDFLAIEPKDRVSEDNFWNEEKDIEQMVTGTYVKLQNQDIIQRCIIWGEARSNNIGGGNNYKTNLDVYNVLRENLTPTNAYTSWTSFYAVINQCNTIIERSAEVHEKAPSYTYSEMLATQAEMTFLRDLCYFYLVRAFKDVPYYTNAIQADEQVKPIAPTNGDEIVRKMITELETVLPNAIKVYPDDNESGVESDCNRVTQTSIYALLADLCLWDNQYDKCVEYSDSVISAKRREYEELLKEGSANNLYNYSWSGDDSKRTYPLIPTYQGSMVGYGGASFNAIFGGSTYATGNSFESIFELAFNPRGTSDNNEKNYAVGVLYGNYYSRDGNAGKGLLAASDKVAPDVVNKSGKVFEHNYDARFYENLYDEEGTYATAYPTKYVATNIYIESLTPESNNMAWKVNKTMRSTTGDYINTNWIFYRLTDVMLMQAEALIERAASDNLSTTDGAGTVTYDDDLRRAFGLIWCVNRRSVMEAPSTSIVGKTYELKERNTRVDLRQLCKEERRRELMFEGKHFFDVIRYCRRENKLNIEAKSGAARISQFDALYWPYNKNEVKVNSLLDQKAYYANSSDDEKYGKTN